jgi:hypothetical protein
LVRQIDEIFIGQPRAHAAQNRESAET